MPPESPPKPTSRCVSRAQPAASAPPQTRQTLQPPAPLPQPHVATGRESVWAPRPLPAPAPSPSPQSLNSEPGPPQSPGSHPSRLVSSRPSQTSLVLASLSKFCDPLSLPSSGNLFRNNSRARLSRAFTEPSGIPIVFAVAATSIS